MNEPLKREGCRLVHEFPPGVEVVGMVTWRGAVWVATRGGLYKIEHDPVTEIRVSEVDLSEGPQT